MALLGGLIGKLIGAAVLLAILLIVGGGFAYATDYGLEATVVESDCIPGQQPYTVTVKTKVGGIERDVEVEQLQCGVLQPGNFVVYHVRSEHTIIYQSEGGQCLYDTVTGPNCPPV